MALAQTPEEIAALYRFDTPAYGVETFADVTPADIEFYRENGYLVVRQAYTQEEVQRALDGFLALIGGSRPDFKGVQFEAWATEEEKKLPPEQRQDYVRKLAWYVEYDERLAAMAQKPEMLRLVEALMGKKPTLFQDMALSKPPRGGREKPWHQDKAYFDLPVDAPVVGVWIALDEASAENGCMHVIPGSHKEGPVVHFLRRDWQICDTDVQTSRDVYVPLKPGGALFFDGMIHHGTAPNQSTKRRRALQFHYAPADAVKISREERLAIWGSEGKNVEC